MKRFLQTALLWAMCSANAFADVVEININKPNGTNANTDVSGSGWNFKGNSSTGGLLTITEDGTYIITGSSDTVKLYVSLSESSSTAKNYDLTTYMPYSLTGQAIARRPITINTAFVAERIYDGTDAATIDSVRFNNLVAGEKFAKSDYTVDSARFVNKNVGGSDTVKLYVSLSESSNTAKNYDLTTYMPYSLTDQAIARRPITIDTAFVGQKIYDGTDAATIDSVAFKNLVPGETLAKSDYTVDSARFVNKNVGGSDTVRLYVSLSESEKAKNYELTNGKDYPLRGQQIEKATPDTSHLVFELPDTVVYSGEKNTVWVSLKGKYSGMGAITVLYNGRETQPDSARRYAITVNIADSTNFEGIDGLALDTLTILQAAPTKEHLIFARDSVVVYDGAKHGIPVSLNPKYTGMDSIVVKYNDTTALPVNAGKYAVTVDLRSNVNFSDSLRLLLDTLTIVPDTIEITGATVKEKIYDGKDSATVTEVEFDGLKNGETLELIRDYVVDSARFDSPDVGKNKTVTVYVSLTASDTAKNYVLHDRQFLQTNQAIDSSPQKIIFPKTDDAIYVRNGKYTLVAIDSTGGAPALPVKFELKPDGTEDAALTGSDTLTPLQPGTVYVTASVEQNKNYKYATPVTRKFIISDRDRCTVTFKSNGGDTIYPVTVAKADTVRKPQPDPTYSGRKFGGWYADADFQNEWHFSTDRVRQDTTLHARWGYTVTFDYRFDEGGRSKKRDTVVVDGGVASPRADTVRTGYRFGGWYINSDVSAHKWNFSLDTIRQDTTLYARWDTIKYSITYHFNYERGGRNHADNPDTFTVATDTFKLYDAALMGDSIFAGWYAEENFSGEQVTEIRKGSAENVELWAKWEYKRICVTIPNIN